MTTDVIGRALVMLIAIATILALAPIAVVQIGEYVKRQHEPDGLQAYRLATAGLVGALAEIMGWRSLIWIDATIWNGMLLGPTLGRWRIDLFIGVTILLAVLFVAYVFWRDRLATYRTRPRATSERRSFKQEPS